MGCFRRLRISWNEAAGFKALVNISGAGLRAIYPLRQWDKSDLDQFTLPDVFSSTGAKMRAGSAADFYLAATDASEQRRFLCASKTLATHLAMGDRCYEFFHRGRGRSPAVAASALSALTGADAVQAAQLIMRLHPDARITAVTLAAITWANEQLQGEVAA